LAGLFFAAASPDVGLDPPPAPPQALAAPAQAAGPGARELSTVRERGVYGSGASRNPALA